jgi:oligoendopeptidase F
MRLLALVLAMGVSLAVPLMAAEAGAFDPLPGNQRDLFRFDLKKNFYAGEAGWRADVDRARALTDAVAKQKGRVAENPRALLEAFTAYRDLQDVLVKLFAYGEFRAAVAVSDRGPLEAYQELEADASARTAFLFVEAKALTPERLADFMKREPGLSAFTYQIDDAVRQGPHTLDEARESVLAQFGPDRTAWQPALFQKVFDRTPFPQIPSDGAIYDAYRDFDGLMRNPDRRVREVAFKGTYATFADVADLLGFALLKEMQAYNKEARLRGFADYYDEQLFARYLTPAQVDNLYAQIESRLPLYHDYQRFRMEQVKRSLGVAEAEVWDMDVPPKGASEPRFTAGEAVALTKDSLSVLGPEYGAALAALIDPKNGRMDIVGGPGRDQGAFCEGYFGFFLDNYQGYLTNVSTLAHEAGHGVHDRLVTDNTGHLLYGMGPNYMTESFAMFNEWLLRDRLYGTVKDPAVLATLRQEEVGEMMVLWELARRAKFERVAYARVASGEITDEKGFNKACEDVGKVYDLWFQRYPELEFHWIRKHHYWTVPTYYNNYVVAQILALTYYQHYLADPKGFPPKYVAMVKNGFDRPAAALLKDFLGIDLNDPKVLDGVFSLVEARFRAVEKKG